MIKHTLLRNGILLSIVLISGLMHLEHFSKDLVSIHVWRQTQTQSNIINFYEEDMNILNPRRNDRGDGDGIFRMEFPLMQWLAACGYKVFGNHLVITRLFMFAIGLLSVLGIYKMLISLFQNKVLALMGAWAFNFSPCFYYYTINPIPDNLALCASIWGTTAFFLWYRRKDMYLLLSGGFLLSVATLCKLPFILYFSLPVCYLIIDTCREGLNKEFIRNGIAIVAFIIMPLVWYVSVIPQWTGNGIIGGMLSNELPFPVILNNLIHNLVSTLPELLLNYGSFIFFLAGLYFIIRNKVYHHSLFPILVIWSFAILFYFFFEINMIADVHDYYLFPFLPILFILVGYGAFHLYSVKIKWIKYCAMALLLMLPLFAYLRMLSRWNTENPGFNIDLLKYKTELRNAVPKDALCIVGNDKSHYIYFYYIDKKGWGFHNDQLTGINVEQMITDGAQYLYSDSRKIENDGTISKYLDELILKKGAIRIFRLKPAE